MYVNPNFLVELQLDRQLPKHQIRTYLLISYRIFCSSKDKIMLAFLFLVSLENVYQQDIKIKMNISLSNAPRFLSNAKSMRADSFYNFLKNCLTTVSDIIMQIFFFIKLTNKQILWLFKCNLSAYEQQTESPPDKILI